MKKLRFMAAILALFLLAGCSANGFKTKVDMTGYVASTLNLEAVGHQTAYGYPSDNTGLQLYSISGQKPSDFLVETSAEMGTDTLYQSKNVTVPVLDTFGTTEIGVYNTQGFSQGTAITKIDDLNVIQQIISNIDDNKNVPTDNSSMEVTKELKFISPNYPGIAYVYTFARCSDGDFILSPDGSTMIPIDNLLKSYIH